MACGRRVCEGLSRLQRGMRSLSRASAKSAKLSNTLQIRSLPFAEVLFNEHLLESARRRVHDVLNSALEELRRKINLAFVYGSVARSGETARSDVDLMVVGKVDFSTVVSKVAKAQKALNREINPTVYSVKEFQSKLRGNFLKNVLAEKKLFIIGDENVLRQLGEK
jgi:predicted nucleotidyltransferase